MILETEPESDPESDPKREYERDLYLDSDLNSQSDISLDSEGEEILRDIDQCKEGQPSENISPARHIFRRPKIISGNGKCYVYTLFIKR